MRKREREGKGEEKKAKEEEGKGEEKRAKEEERKKLTLHIYYY